MKFKCLCFVVLGLFLITSKGSAQGATSDSLLSHKKEISSKRNGDNGQQPGSYPQFTPPLHKTRLYLFYGSAATFDLYGFYKLQDLWYKSPTTHFHFVDPIEDFKIFKQMDKIGHVTHAYYASHLASSAYLWAGYPRKKAIIYGAIFSSVWMLQIEVADAFFVDWGFSPGDLAANLAGSWYAALQQLYPETLGGIRLKVSYHHSYAYKNHLWNDINKSFIDDYEGMTMWMALNIHRLVPEKWATHFPVWLRPLGLAVGYSANAIARDYYGGNREIYLGLDLDLNQIPVANHGFLKFMKEQFNIIRLPLPAVKIYPHTIWYGFYF